MGDVPLGHVDGGVGPDAIGARLLQRRLHPQHREASRLAFGEQAAGARRFGVERHQALVLRRQHAARGEEPQVAGRRPGDDLLLRGAQRGAGRLGRQARGAQARATLAEVEHRPGGEGAALEQRAVERRWRQRGGEAVEGKDQHGQLVARGRGLEHEARQARRGGFRRVGAGPVTPRARGGDRRVLGQGPRGHVAQREAQRVLPRGVLRRGVLEGEQQRESDHGRSAARAVATACSITRSSCGSTPATELITGRARLR